MFHLLFRQFFNLHTENSFTSLNFQETSKGARNAITQVHSYVAWEFTKSVTL